MAVAIARSYFCVIRNARSRRSMRPSRLGSISAANAARWALKLASRRAAAFGGVASSRRALIQGPRRRQAAIRGIADYNRSAAALSATGARGTAPSRSAEEVFQDDATTRSFGG